MGTIIVTKENTRVRIGKETIVNPRSLTHAKV